MSDASTPSPGLAARAVFSDQSLSDAERDAEREAYEAAFPWPTRFPPPVGWMLSPELLSQLGNVVRKRVDPRRWMRLRAGHAHIEDGGADPGRWARVVADRSGDAVDVVPPTSGELWFDYCADIGDGFAAQYSLGYLLQADLALVDRLCGGALADAPTDAARLRATGAPVAVEIVDQGKVASGAYDGRRLPRGQFLFVGGDTAYHVADRPTLVWRLQSPMYWAARDLRDAGRLGASPARIYGIPGNHDWYDHLDGFSRVFCDRGRDPILPDGADAAQRTRWDAAISVPLDGFEPRQRASYLAIQLPWQWQLWGLDIDQPLDALQQAYFASQTARDRLVVCVPTPPVVFHRGPAETGNLGDACRALDLPPLYADGLAVGPVEKTCRLDLSGDVHHYARYAGAWDLERTDRSYQAVVSGLGGAFLHSTETVHGDRAPVEDTPFPKPDEARTETAVGTNWWRLFTGGWMRGIPVILCALCAASWIEPGLSQRFADFWLRLLGIDGGDGRWWLAEPPWDWCRAPVAAGYLAEAKAVLALGGVVVFAVGAGLYVSHMRRRRVDLSLGDPRSEQAWWAWLVPWRSYAPAWMLMIVGIAGVVVGRWLAPGAVSAVLLDAAVIALVIGAPLAASVGIASGRAKGQGGRQVGYAAVAAGLHVVIQFLTLLILVRVGLAAPLATAAMLAGYLGLSLRLPAWLVKRGWAGRILLVWLVLVAVTLGVIVFAADHRTVDVAAAAKGDGLSWLGLLQRLVVVGGSSVLAMFVGSAHFGWYLAAARRFHNNELGGAARVDRFRQFIRFRLTAEGLTGYVIGLEQVVREFPRDPTGKAQPAAASRDPRPGSPAELRPFLVDVFTVAPAAVAAPAAPSLDPVDSPDRDRERDRG